jgi:hypothetical protein
MLPLPCFAGKDAVNTAKQQLVLHCRTSPWVHRLWFMSRYEQLAGALDTKQFNPDQNWGHHYRV